MKRNHMDKAVTVHHPASLWRDFDKWDSGVTVRETGGLLAAIPGARAVSDEVDSLFDQVDTMGC